MTAHDLAAFKIGPEDYLQRYFIGHYNPLGNQFQAFAINNALVAMLEPQPPAHQPAE